MADEFPEQTSNHHGRYVDPSGYLEAKCAIVKDPLMINAIANDFNKIGMLSIGAQAPESVKEISPLSQGVANWERSSLSPNLVYLFQKLDMPVSKPTRMVSRRGFRLMMGMRRKVLAQILDALTKSAPTVPPVIPMRMNIIISNDFQSVL